MWSESLIMLGLPHAFSLPMLPATTFICVNSCRTHLMPFSNSLQPKLSIKCVSVMAGPPFLLLPLPLFSPLIVDLLVCPRIDVIPRRLPQRFSFSFCWLCPSLSLSASPASLSFDSSAAQSYSLPGRKDPRGFRCWLRLLIAVASGQNFCRPWDLFDFLFRTFCYGFLIFFLFIINYILGKWTAVPFSLSLSLCLRQLPI